MKNLILFFVLLLLCGSFSAKAQPRDTGHWAPAGASWIYSAPAIGMELYYQFDYVGDTMIQNLPMKKIEYSTFNFPMPGPGVILPRTPNGHITFLYFYQNQDSVFWYDNNTLRLLYVFDTPIGGSWVIDENLHYDCASRGFNLAPTDSAIVTNMSASTFDGQTFEILNLDFNRSDWYLGGGLIKNIGSPETFLPYPVPPYDCPTDGMVHIYNGLVCYSDSIRPTFSTPRGNSSGGCGRLILSTTNVPANDKIDFKIFPNPNNGILNIVYPNSTELYSIQIVDIWGRAIFYSNNQESSISISHLPAGVYVVSLLQKKQIIANQKLIKL